MTAAGDRDDLTKVVARLTDDEPLDRRTRAGLVGRLAVLVAAQGRRLVDVVIDVAPHIPIRDRATLRAHHGGLDDDELATALIATATRVTGAIGAAGGLLSTVEMAAPPMLLTAPVQVAAETLAVVAVELKLIAELHEVYGRSPVGTPTVRAAAYLGAWARRRGIDPLTGGAGLTGVISGAARRELRQRLIRRAGRNITTVIPFLAGAVAGAALNQRETRRLGERIAADLHR
ncbi:MAG: hypothetical protein QOF18_100 [Frankiaceae bacterium]|jgi:hypothetical protein|nr:hypothetical protein [Frankiaceae bacterium]